jgi:KipI family sensor histidine kinase inhibitor
VAFPRVLPVGDSAATVELGPDMDPRAVALAAALLADPPAWLEDAVPTLGAVLVRVGPSVSWADVEEVLLARAAAAPPAQDVAGRELVLLARYDGADLPEVARATGLTPDEVVALHASVTYRVQMVGFLPGFAYLGPLPEALRLPRRDTPRVRVPAGALAVAEAFSAVYPSESPGGWHLIGSVDAALFDPRREPPVLLAPGDTVRFEP